MVPAVIELREWALAQAHDAVGSGHLGRDKTLEKLSRRFYWAGMTQDVANYCSTCDICQFSKKRRHKTDGLLHPLPVPLKRWQVVAVDFVTGLPTTTDGYNAIATWTDKLTKMVHLVPYRFDDSSALNIAKMYLDHIWRLHGAPMQIVCDRDPRLVSSFFRDFSKLLGTKVSPTTAFHPQGDGQSENTNQTMEQVLRALIDNPHDTKWDQLLSQVEFAINDSVHAVHGYTPFELNYGEPVRSTLDWVLAAHRHTPASNFEADQLTDQVRHMVAKARQLLEAANAKTADRGKKSHRDVTYQVNDRVILSTRHLTIASDRNTRPKVRKPYCGPFTIDKVLYTSDRVPHAYRLRLPPLWRMHPVFKAEKLEPYQDGTNLFPNRRQTPPLIPQVDNESETGEIDRLLAEREVLVRRGNRTTQERQWLTRFKGEGAIGDRWLSIEQLSDELGECEAWKRFNRAKENSRFQAAAHGQRPTAGTARAVDHSLRALREAQRKYVSYRTWVTWKTPVVQEYENNVGGKRVLTLSHKAGPTWQIGSRRLRALVLFSGTGSVERMIHTLFRFAEVVSVDFLPKWTPTHCVDILEWANPEARANFQQYPEGYFDVIWASPPCEEYSQAKTRGNRNLQLADQRVKATLFILNQLKPAYWYIENPRSYDPVGLRWRPCMRQLDYMQGPFDDFLHETNYCKYGSPYLKPTNIWTNVAGLSLAKCSKETGYCEYRKKHGIHAQTAQGGPTGPHLKGSGGGKNVYPIPDKLLRVLFLAMKFG